MSASRITLNGSHPLFPLSDEIDLLDLEVGKRLGVIKRVAGQIVDALLQLDHLIEHVPLQFIVLLDDFLYLCLGLKT